MIEYVSIPKGATLFILPLKALKDLELSRAMKRAAARLRAAQNGDNATDHRPERRDST